jgi:hypothetical protein
LQKGKGTLAQLRKESLFGNKHEELLKEYERYLRMPELVLAVTETHQQEYHQ